MPYACLLSLIIKVINLLKHIHLMQQLHTSSHSKYHFNAIAVSVGKGSQLTCNI